MDPISAGFMGFPLLRPGGVKPHRAKRNGMQYPWLNIPRTRPVHKARGAAALILGHLELTLQACDCVRADPDPKGPRLHNIFQVAVIEAELVAR